MTDNDDDVWLGWNAPLPDVLVFEPHLDDAVLFATWRILHHEAGVISVLADSCLQEWLGVTSEMRLEESARAMEVLGAPWKPWMVRDDEPDWDDVEDRMCALLHRYKEAGKPVFVWTSAIEPGGNPQHSVVGRLTVEVFGHERVGFYTTYTGAPGVKTRAIEVPFEQAWLEAKHRALACYRSQINVKSGAYRFFVEDLREYEP